MAKLTISTKQKGLIKKIAQKYSLELLLLFGSRVHGKVIHKESDYDVAYLSKRNLDLMEEARLICDLMPIFKSDNVDLANIKRAGPVLMKQIFDEHIVLFCGNIMIYYKYRIYAERKFVEARPLFEVRDFLIKKFLRDRGK